MKWSACGHFWETCVQEHFFFPVLRTVLELAVAIHLCFDHWHLIPTGAMQVANMFNVTGQISFAITIKAIVFPYFFHWE